jgi:hypothetical protein
VEEARLPASDARLAAEILAQFRDAATVHFDEVLATMPLDDAQRRELRYWQRQSLSALRDYAAVALPAALTAVAAAQQDTLAAVDAAARTWADSGPAAAEAPTDPLELRRRSVAARLASGA